MEGTPMRLVILILGALGFVALIGAIALKGVAIASENPAATVPNELWMVVSGVIAAIGALLANPRSGASTTRATDTIPIGEVESIQVDPEK